MTTGCMIDTGIDGSGNLAREYYPDAIRGSHQTITATAAESPTSWWSQTNWFRSHADTDTNQPSSTATNTTAAIISAPGHARCFNRFSASNTKIPITNIGISNSTGISTSTGAGSSSVSTVDKKTRHRVKTILSQASQGYSAGIARQINDSILLPLTHPSLFTNIGLSCHRAVLITGQSGCGKTRLMQTITGSMTNIYSQSLNAATLTSVQTPTVIGGIGTSTTNDESLTPLDRAFRACVKNAPAILFIDDIDLIASSGNDSRQYNENPIITKMRLSLKMHLDTLTSHTSTNSTKPVIVIGATSNSAKIDSSFLRSGRFDTTIALHKPDDSGRLKILQSLTATMRLHSSVNLSEVANLSQGMIGSDLMALCREAGLESIREALRRRSDEEYMNDGDDYDSVESVDTTALTITHAHFLSALSLVRPSMMRGDYALGESMMDRSLTMDSVGGYDSTKQLLFETLSLPIKHPAVYRHYHQALSDGILLYGPSGCGKSLLVKCLCNTLNVSMLVIKGSDILNSYLGESEKNLRAFFQKGRESAPCLLLIDEIDSIGGRRGSHSRGDSTMDRIINTLLTEIDDTLAFSQSVMIVAATNRPELLDSALVRPGRFNELVYLGLPTMDDRLSILTKSLASTPVDSGIDDSYLRGLSVRVDGYSGADIVNVVNRARRMVITHAINHRAGESENKAVLTEEMLEHALLSTAPSVDAESLQRLEWFQYKHSHTSTNTPNDDDEKSSLSTLRASIRSSVNAALQSGLSPQQALNHILLQFNRKHSLSTSSDSEGESKMDSETEEKQPDDDSDDPEYSLTGRGGSGARSGHLGRR